jgi:hypothetical protein
MTSAAAEAILEACSEVAPANHTLEDHVEGLLKEVPYKCVGIASEIDLIVVMKARR